MTTLPTPADDAAIRTALIAHLAEKLAQGAPAPAGLAEAVAPLSTLALCASLRPSRDDTLDALARALDADADALTRAEQIQAITAELFPKLATDARERLAAFAVTLDRLREAQGCVTAADVYRHGFRSREASELTPRAGQILGRLGAREARPPAGDADARFSAAVARAVTRRVFTALAA